MRALIYLLICTFSASAASIPPTVFTEFVKTNLLRRASALDEIGGLNVRWFGVKGDGVNDDTVALQAAINSLPTGKNAAGLSGTNQCGEVYLPPGLYLISAPIKVPAGIILKGSGPGSTVITNSTTLTNSIEIRNDSNINHHIVGVRDLGIYGALTTNATAGAGISCLTDLSWGNAPWPQIENVWVIGHKHGIQISNAVMGSISDCKVKLAGDSGIKISGTLNAMRISGNYSQTNHTHGWEIDATAGYYSTFTANASDSNGGDGWRIGTASEGRNLQSVIFAGNGAEVNQGNGFTLFNCHNIDFKGNGSFYNASNGVEILGGDSITVSEFTSMVDGGSSIHLDVGLYSMPAGVTVQNLSGDAIYGGRIAVNNPTNVIWTWNPVLQGKIHDWSRGQLGVRVNYGYGNVAGVGIGTASRTNVDGFMDMRRFARLTLGPWEDAASTNFYFQLQNDYDSSETTKFIGAYGSKFMSFGQPGGGVQQLNLFPLASGKLGQSEGRGKINVGFASTAPVGAAVAVNGGLNVGATNEVTTGKISASVGYQVGTTNGATETIDVLVAGGTTNRLQFIGGVLWTNIVNHY